jgi:hypothetical protein
VDQLIAGDKDSEAKFALIIDGKALAACLTKRLAHVFLRVGLRCTAVVCCRVSPLQKAQVTQLVGHRARGGGRLAGPVACLRPRLACSTAQHSTAALAVQAGHEGPRLAGSGPGGVSGARNWLWACCWPGPAH